MHTVYNFLTGPFVWLAFVVFLGGTLYKILSMLFLVYKKERFIFSFMSLKYSLRSIAHWLTPFGTTNMRLHPVMTVVTFIFHLCLFLTPVFLLAHIVLLSETWNISYWSFPDLLADGMTLIIICACLFFLIRRLRAPEVRYVTGWSDYFLLLLVAVPFMSGFWVYHQFPGHPYALLLHIFSGGIMLMAIPFTRLSHMILSVFTRAYMGSEFGGVRHARDW